MPQCLYLCAHVCMSMWVYLKIPHAVRDVCLGPIGVFRHVCLSVCANRLRANRCERARTGANRCEPVQTGANRCEPVRTGANRCEPVRIGANRCEPVRTGANRCEPVRSGAKRCEAVRSGAKRCASNTRRARCYNGNITMFDR